MKYDLTILQSYIDQGLIEVQSHPTLPLKIYNYSRECAWEKKWDNITLNMRGTILDNNGNLVACGFRKFFNFEEHKYEEIPWNDGYVYIQDKADGSLGIIFYYANEWHVATRGSFTSNQAIKGKEILNKKYNLKKFIPAVTYLVEIIYPENQIVVNYKSEEKLIFLSAHWDTNKYPIENNDTLKYNEINWVTAVTIFRASGIPEEDVVNTTQVQLNKLDINELRSKNISNKEGYVLRFYPSNFRMKIKFEEYVRLHSLMTQFSNVDIWECLKNNTPIDLDKVPDEFDTWVKKTIQDLNDKYNIRFKELENEFWKTINRKEYYFQVKSHKDSYMLLKRLSSYSKEYQNMIWDEIRPEYSKPFWKKEIDN